MIKDEMDFPSPAKRERVPEGRVRVLGVMLLYLVLMPCYASIESDFATLSQEIRCVTCPNQSIADSQAPIAIAMREEIYRRLEQGETVESIRGYLLSHYGEAITYRPPMQQSTWLLWVGPFLMMVLACLGWYRLR